MSILMFRLTFHFMERLNNKIHKKLFEIYFWNPSKNYVVLFLIQLMKNYPSAEIRSI